MKIIEYLSAAITEHQTEVSSWFQKNCQAVNLPIYASVDLRNAGFKVSVVDTNLFPAGFNNIFPRDLSVASGFVEKYLQKHFPTVRKVLILPENHTRNQPYLANLFALQQLLSHAGYQVQIGSLNPDIRKDRLDIDLGHTYPLTIHRSKRQGKRLVNENFDPDLVLVNNDFNQGLPDELQDLEQPVIPPVEAGWHARRKSRHFEFQHALIDEFSQIIEVDPWLMKAETHLVEGVDIQNQGSREKLAEVAESILKNTHQRYQNWHVQEKPYVFVKDNSGTYGLAVMATEDPQEILDLNSKSRKKMAAGKGRTTVSEMIVQEGVPTKIEVSGCPAEPVIYLAAGEVIGGFFRKHCSQDELKSLNVRGALFSLLTFSSPLDTTVPQDAYRDDKQLQVYGSLAKLAYLALAREIEELVK